MLKTHDRRPPFNRQSSKFFQTEALIRELDGTANSSIRVKYLDHNKNRLTFKLIRSKRHNAIVLFDGFPPAFTDYESRLISQTTASIKFNAFQDVPSTRFADHMQKYYKIPRLLLDLRGNNGGIPDILVSHSPTSLVQGIDIQLETAISK